MSNIKLKDHNWAAEGIYDTNQSKSQQTINSDVSTKIGQATLQTSSQNLSGATNELKGRADTLDSKYDNVVTVANTQPSSEYNKVWLPLTVSEGTQVPTWAEHQALDSAISDVADDVSDLGTLTKVTIPYTSFSTNKGTIQNVSELRIAYNDKFVFCSGYIRISGLAQGDNPDVTITIPQDVPSFWGYCPPTIRRPANSTTCVIDDPGYFSHTKGYATSVFHCYNYIGAKPDGYFQAVIPPVIMT